MREALWGKPQTFSETHPFFLTLAKLSQLRNGEPSLRYGRQYFRPLSGDGIRFGISHFRPGVLAFSRILDSTELLVVANTASTSWEGEVVVDAALNRPGTSWQVLFSNQTAPEAAGLSLDKPGGSVTIHEVSGALTHGPACALPVRLRPMEILVYSVSR